jgi:hypothetical protein
LIFWLKKEIKSELSETCRPWFTSYSAIAVTIFWYAFSQEFRIRIGRMKIPNGRWVSYKAG